MFISGIHGHAKFATSYKRFVHDEMQHFTNLKPISIFREINYFRDKVRKNNSK